MNGKYSFELIYLRLHLPSLSSLSSDINYIQSGDICMRLSDVPGKIDMVGDYGYDVTNAPLPPCVNGTRLVPSG